ncbi:hypothetical protein HFO91_22480 [Rhizobium leguminosarum]|uniref:HEPN/Toprim-associated domain-containing protein n=1 Tax=Rhizobium leguminosarum TaxID=384 RepID=UPI001C95595F|nr:HEPN/Toprim-associated domain-containing protein [Rhizobium leguminosarum]MBY5452384.1 hypothetical protein [Rhizobium leguminosarum]
MGTVISLDIGAIELTWSKNHPGINHGPLFHALDRKDIKDGDHRDAQESPGYRAPLRSIVPRLELMGHTLTRAKAEYEAAVSFGIQERRDRAEWDPAPIEWPEMFAFDEIFRHIRAVRPQKLSTSIDDEEQNPRRVLTQAEMQRLPWYEIDSYQGQSFEADTVFSESTSAGYLLGGFDPYTALRLLAEAPENLECDVTWHFGPLVMGGYAEADEFEHGLQDAATFLIVTEVSSDAKILRHTISLHCPEIADFFRYIDMEEGYPFSGTGNLQKFVQGLIALRTPINVVAIFDNDAEGVAAYLKTQQLNLRDSYRVCRLPDLVEFENFPTRGPTGDAAANINGRAAAIECYLDLTRIPRQALVEWGGFSRDAGQYQGSLLGKTAYMEDFLSFKGRKDRRGGYDMSKIISAVAVVVAECVSVAEAQGLAVISRRRRR